MDHECMYMCGATDNQSGSVPPHGRPSEDIRTPPPTSRSSRSFHVYIRIRNKHTYTQGSLRAMARTAHTSTHAAWRHAPQIIHPEPHQNPPFLLPPAVDPLATLCIHPELWKLALDTIQCNGKSSNEVHNVSRPTRNFATVFKERKSSSLHVRLRQLRANAESNDSRHD